MSRAIDAGPASARAVTQHATSMAARLHAERHRLFVGRSAELTLFHRLLRERECSLLFLRGQVGVGKTGLLLEYERHCLDTASPVARLDAAEFAHGTLEARERVERGVLEKLNGSAGVAFGRARPVLLLDSYEGHGGDTVLRDLLPKLPGDVLLVLASRHPPPPELQLEPAWSSFMERHELRPLTGPEARDFLGLRGIPVAAQERLLEITAGFPLALTLGAELLLRPSDEAGASNAFEELQRHLYDLVCSGPILGSQRIALDVCSLARTTTTELLDHVLRANPGEEGDARDLFAWLGRLSFVDRSSKGLRPHVLARAALLARARREQPKSYQVTYRAVREFCVDQFAAGRTPESGLIDLFYLDRDLPLLRKYGLPETEPEPSNALIEPARERDAREIFELIGKAEGQRSAELAAQRLRRAPHEFELLRSQSVDGLLHVAALHDFGAGMAFLPEQDPSSPSVRKFMADNPLGEGEGALFFRWFLDRLDYQTPSARVFSLAARQAQLVLAQKRIVYSLCVLRNPQEWAGLYQAANVPWRVVGRFESGAHAYSVVAFCYREHTLRDRLVDAWKVPDSSAVCVTSEVNDEAKLKIRRRVAKLGRDTQLTPRELQLLELLCLGNSFVEIAAQLNIRPRTVKFHHENLLRKTGADSRQELFRKLL